MQLDPTGYFRLTAPNSLGTSASGAEFATSTGDALGVNADRSYKCTPFCWSPGSSAAKTGAWGIFVNTPGRVMHGVGHPEWSHRSYVVVVDDEALDLFLIAGRDPAQVLERYATLT